MLKEKDQDLIALKEELHYKEKLLKITNSIHAAKNLDEIFIHLHGKIMDLFDADKMKAGQVVMLLEKAIEKLFWISRRCYRPYGFSVEEVCCRKPVSKGRAGQTQLLATWVFKTSM